MVRAGATICRRRRSRVG